MHFFQVWWNLKPHHGQHADNWSRTCRRLASKFFFLLTVAALKFLPVNICFDSLLLRDEAHSLAEAALQSLYFQLVASAAQNTLRDWGHKVGNALSF